MIPTPFSQRGDNATGEIPLGYTELEKLSTSRDIQTLHRALIFVEFKCFWAAPYLEIEIL